MKKKKSLFKIRRRGAYERDLVKLARSNHIWLNAFACVSPTPAFLQAIGKDVLDMLRTEENLIAAEHQLLGTEKELVLRINRS